MASQEERDNFFSLTLLLFRVGNQKFRKYFKAQWPIVYQLVRPGTVTPPWKDTPHDATEMKKIQPTKLMFKFKDEEIKFNSGNTNDWDFSLLTTVLRYSSLNFVSSPQSNALDNLKDIRNKLTGHPTDAAISNAVFNTAWTDACNALKLFNATAADFKSVQDDVKKPPDVLYPMLLQCVAQEKLDIRHSVDPIINSLQQFQQTVEEQHTTLQQTVEKQTTLQETVEEQHTTLQQTMEQQHATLQQTVEKQTTLQETVEEQHTTLQQTMEQQHATLQQTVEKQTTLQETMHEAVESIGKKVDQLVLDQGQQGQKRSSAETRTGEDVQTEKPRKRDYAEDSKKLKEAVKSNTEYQTKFMAAEDVTSARTDDIFTNLTVYYADKKPVKEEQAKGLGRKEHLQEYTKRKTGVKVEKCEDIFINMEGKNPNLFLTGKPGIGKTFFCEKVMRDWSKDRLFQSEDTPNITFAYLLKFRQLSQHGDKEKMNLRELLNCSPLLDDNSIIDESLFEYLTKNTSEVLIILDGFDECSAKHRKQIASDFEQKYPNDSRSKMPIPALCSKLIKGKLLKNSVVLVSSRPDESHKLGKVDFDRYVEITGFSPQQVTEYVEKYQFSEPEQEQTRNTVREHIEKNEDLVSLCHNPLLSFLLCWCLDWRISQSGITESLPAKITDLYYEVVEVCIQKLHANLKYSEMSEDTRKIAQETLGKLAKLAANLLKKSKYIFDEEDMNQNLTEDEIENLKSSGILHCIPGIRISPFQTKSEFSFTHLTIQEYLAASFFVKNEEIPAESEVTGQTFVFMSGLCSRGKSVKLMEKLIEQVTPKSYDDKVNKLLTLQCLYEYGDVELTKQVINKLYDEYCNSDGEITFGNVTCVDVKGILYLLNIIHSLKEQHPQPSNGHVLCIHNSSLTSFSVGVVCDSLVHNSFITKLWLDDCSLDDKSVDKITNSLANTGITRLKLFRCNIVNKRVKSICKVLTGTKITTLTLSDNKITDKGVESICSVLTGTKITTLTLSDNKITDKGVESICSVLTETKVTHLDLSGNKITDKGVESICSVIIRDNCPVKSLWLCGSEITEKFMNHLEQLVQKHKPGVELII